MEHQGKEHAICARLNERLASVNRKEHALRVDVGSQSITAWLAMHPDAIQTSVTISTPPRAPESIYQWINESAELLLGEILRSEPVQVTDHDALTCLLYLLIRDHLPSGKVESIVRTVEETRSNGGANFSGPHIEAEARELADRVLGKVGGR